MSDWVCSGCGQPIELPSELPRRPCPNCGSTARTANVAVHAKQSLGVYFKTHSKHRYGGKKVLREVIEGDDLFKLTGKWNHVKRTFNRISDWYDELVRDGETGQIIRRKGEPLSEHQKKKSEPTSEDQKKYP